MSSAGGEDQRAFTFGDILLQPFLHVVRQVARGETFTSPALPGLTVEADTILG